MSSFSFLACVAVLQLRACIAVSTSRFDRTASLADQVGAGHQHRTQGVSAAAAAAANRFLLNSTLKETVGEGKKSFSSNAGRVSMLLRRRKRAETTNVQGFTGMLCADIGCGTWSIVCSCDMQCASVYNDCCADHAFTCSLAGGGGDLNQSPPAASTYTTSSSVEPTTAPSGRSGAVEGETTAAAPPPPPPPLADAEGEGRGGASTLQTGEATAPEDRRFSSCAGRCGTSWEDDPNGICYCDFGCSEYNGKQACRYLSLSTTTVCNDYFYDCLKTRSKFAVH